jgi:3-oxoacyl-[acyl-carrier protein] reductase
MKKTVFITGSANGIGKHLSDVFYHQGYNVVATDFLIEKLQNQTKGWNTENCLIGKLNVIDIENWQNVVQKTINKFGKIDILLNVAGVITPGFVEDFALKDIDYHIDINVKGVMYGTKLWRMKCLNKVLGTSLILLRWQELPLFMEFPYILPLNTL